MLESTIERNLRQKVEKLGGTSLKINGTSLVGWPDRVVLLPGGRIRLVELKTKGGRLSKRQEYVHAQLARLGFPVAVLWSTEDVDAFIRFESLMRQTARP